MSTLKVNDIQEATSGGGKIAVARVHSRWSMVGTAALTDSFGVSSFTDQGTGVCRQTFSNNFANANYTVVGLAGRLSDTGNRFLGMHGYLQNPTTSTTDLAQWSSSGSYNDLNYGAAAWFGDT